MIVTIIISQSIFHLTRHPEWQVSWQSVGSLFYQMRARIKRFETVRVRHLDLPLQVSWYKDVELTQFVTLIKKWETGEEPKPSFVITGNENNKVDKTSPFLRNVHYTKDPIKYINSYMYTHNSNIL